MSTPSVDLDGFPIIRLDQISSISSDLLERAQIEVTELIQKLNEEREKEREKNQQKGNQKSFLYYLNKQLEEMEKEMTKRIAEARVLALLNGVSEEVMRERFEFKSTQSLHLSSLSTSSPRAESVRSSRSEGSNETSIPVLVEEKEKPKFRPIPLPSELRKQNYVAPPSQSLVSSRSTDDTQSRDFVSDTSGRADQEEEGENLQRRRPKSGQPSRRSLAVVEENFASSFVVSAVEKKKRFYPKKVVKESEQDIREKNRESRLLIPSSDLIFS